MRLVARRGLPGGPRPGGAHQRRGHRRRRRRPPEPLLVPLLQQDPGALAQRSMPSVRRGGRRDRHQRGVRRRRPEAARGCRARRRPDLCRDPGRRRGQRRARAEPDRPAAGRAGPGAAPGLCAGRLLAGDRRPDRGARDRDGGRRPGGGRRPSPRSSTSPGPPVRRARSARSSR